MTTTDKTLGLQEWVNDTYTVEIVGIADRQGGEEEFYMIDISHR